MLRRTRIRRKNRLIEEREEHRLVIVSMVVAETVLIQIILEILGRNSMINTTDTILAVGPKAFNGVGVNAPTNIDFLGVGHAPMSVSHHWQRIIDFVFIGVDGRAMNDILLHHREDCPTVSLFDRASLKLALALDDTDNRGFVIKAVAFAAARVLATKVTFVNLDFTHEQAVIFLKRLAYFLAHTPCRFVGNARLAFNLFGRNAAAGLSHLVDNVEPGSEGSAGLVKDRSGGRGNLIPAIITGVLLALADLVKLGFLFTARAFNSFRVSLVANVLKAGVIVREHLYKVLDGEFLHSRLFLLFPLLSHVSLSSINYLTKLSIQENVLVVKGYSPVFAGI